MIITPAYYFLTYTLQHPAVSQAVPQVRQTLLSSWSVLVFVLTLVSRASLSLDPQQTVLKRHWVNCHTSATVPDLQAISLMEASFLLSQCPCWPIHVISSHVKWREEGLLPHFHPHPPPPGIPARPLHFSLPSMFKFPFLVICVARCWWVSYRDWPPLVLHQLRALLKHVPLPLPAPCVSRFVALHCYSAHGPEELDLQKGEGIRVLGKYQDGWLKGFSLLTGRTGIFPSDYVIPVFR